MVLSPRWSPSLLAVATVALCAACGPAADLSDPALAARTLQALNVKNVKQLAVGRSATDGAVQGLYGRLPAVDISELSARDALQDAASLLRVDPETTLVLERESVSPLGRHYLFRQYVGEVPVHGAWANVSFNNAGAVVALSSSLVRGAARVAGGDELDPSTAIDLVRAQLGGGRGRPTTRDVPTTERVVHVANGRAALAFKVTLPTGDGPTWEAIVDAHDGTLRVAPHDTNRYSEGTGRIWKGKTTNAVVALLDPNLSDSGDSANAVPDEGYEVVTLPNLVGNGALDGLWASSNRTTGRAFSATDDYLFDRSQVGFTETVAYFHIDLSAQYQHALGFPDVMSHVQQFSANGTSADNSWYTPSNRVITYGTGGVDDGEDAEVVLHELGHAIQDDQVPGWGESLEAGSMGEAFGDYWAASRGAETSGGFQDECIMDWDATSYSSANPPCLRRLDTGKHYPEDLNFEVHDDGEIWSHALWQIHQELGQTKADILILAHHFMLPVDASFNTAANAMANAARDLSNNPVECEVTKAAMAARGFTVTAACQ